MNANSEITWTNCPRITRTACLHLKGPVAKVFPLFGPLQEKEWAFGWDPKILYSTLPCIEEKMIFRTTGAGGDFTWIVGRFEPLMNMVEYIVFTSTRVWFIKVSCVEQANETMATVTYTYTGLTDDGAVSNENALREMFRHDLKDWEEAINHYLITGHILQPEQALFN